MLLERLIGRTMFVARTDGMRPGIFAGDVVVVRIPRSRRQTYAVGDIIAFRPTPDSRLAARRISDVICSATTGVEYLAHEDDAEVDVHSSLSPSQIVGQVEARLANVGRMWHEARSCRSRASLSRMKAAPNMRRGNMRDGR